jgi:hypothetical protein
LFFSTRLILETSGAAGDSERLRIVSLVLTRRQGLRREIVLGNFTYIY